MRKVPITNLCWGCGSATITYKEAEEGVPSLERWNLCPECAKKAKEKRKEEGMKR